MNTCYFCKGPVEPGRIDYMASRAGRYALVKDLRVELCGQCGEAYLDDEASRQIDGLLATAASSGEHVDVPVVYCH